MFQITKHEPTYFTTAKSKVKVPKVKSAWEDGNIREINEKLRGDILLDEQNLLCAYCEKEIDDNSDNSNIDHFKTRNLFPQNTLDYDNLLVSCNSKVHCSYIKDNCSRLNKDDYQNIINPVIQNPNDFFEYSFAGDILPKDGLSSSDYAKADFTIKVFKLDSVSLTNDRQKIAESLIIYKENSYSLNDIFNEINDYKSFIEDIYIKLEET